MSTCGSARPVSLAWAALMSIHAHVTHFGRITAMGLEIRGEVLHHLVTRPSVANGSRLASRSCTMVM